MNTQVNDPKGAAGALKAPMHLIPPYALEQTAWVHKLGSEKYGPYNWRKTGVCATTYVSAIMRHLNAWRDGEDLDPESGISHIAHIASSCNILLDAGHCGTLQDDRNKKPVPNTFAAAVAKAEAIKDESVAPDGLLPFPPVPKGYDRWVYRGRGWSSDKPTKYAYRWSHDKQWNCAKGTAPSGYEDTLYIEAVKDESNASDGLPPYPPVPEGYDRWVYRGKGWRTDRKVCFAATTSSYIEWIVYENGCTVGYESTHYIEAVK